MSTTAQAISSRTNSQQSTGLMIAEGKAKMYANPLRHCLPSRHLTLPGKEGVHPDRALALVFLRQARILNACAATKPPSPEPRRNSEKSLTSS